jgi:carbon monoxide dehydrogenase subunit G
MEFDNAFEVPLPVDQTWKLLMDIQRIAPCLPGAELTEVVDDRTYKGKVGVRLGPVSLAFAGTVKFDEIDDANHRARISAQGSDAKGRGAANATATFHLEPVAAGSKVLVHTNLTLSGSVAQYGRGVGIIQMTAAQIITQFANNLKAQLGPAASPAAAPAAASALPSASATAPPAAAAPAAAPRPGDDTPAKAAPAAAPRGAPTPAAPISGFALAGGVLLAWLKRLFGRG